MTNIEIENELENMFKGFDPMAEVTPEPEIEEPICEMPVEEKLEFKLKNKKENKLVRKDSQPENPVESNEEFEKLGVPAYKSEKCNQSKKQAAKVNREKKNERIDMNQERPKQQMSDIKTNKKTESQASDTQKIENKINSDMKKSAPERNSTESKAVTEEIFEESKEECEILFGEIENNVFNEFAKAGEYTHEKEPEPENEKAFKVYGDQYSARQEKKEWKIPEMEIPKVEIPQFKIPPLIKRSCKQALSFAAMIVVIVGVGVGFSKLSNQNSDNNITQDKGNNSGYSFSLEEENDYQKKEETKDIRITQTSSVKNMSKNINEQADTVNTTSRFQTLDDLILYINSEQGVILSKEKTLVTQFAGGLISKKQFLSEMQEQMDLLDDINRLLLVNKELFNKNGEEETYNILTGNMETIIIYGSKEVYKVQQQQESVIENITEGVNSLVSTDM